MQAKYMHDINYYHEHELRDHDFLGCCKDCRSSLNIIKPHIMAFARKIRQYTPQMLLKLPPDELYRLYQLLDDLAHLDAGEHLAGMILEEEEIKQVLPVIRDYYATFFAIHERQLATRLAEAHNAWQMLTSFPLYPRYEALIKGQMETMPGLTGKRIAFVGCGPVPMSLILMARFYGMPSTGLDVSRESVFMARSVIRSLGLEGLIEIEAGDHTLLKDLSWDVVLVAALAEPKARIFQELRQLLGKERHLKPIIYRTYTGMRAVLYEPVSPSYTKGFRVVQRVLPTGRVNNTTIFAELDA